MSHLSALSLGYFRNYEQLSLNLQPGLTALWGPNGAGKTNILEAISLLAPGRGLRRARLSDLTKINSDKSWAINTKLRTPHGEVGINTGADPSAPDTDRRLVLIENTKVPQHELAEQLSIVWLTPAQDRLWTDSPGARRRFLDQLVTALHPPHASHLSRYEEALAERNRLLKDGALDARWLASLEHILAAEGMAVASSRRELVNSLNAQLQNSKSDAFPSPELSLLGIESWLDEGPALLAEDRLREELAKNRALDTAAGMTTLGPHRSDLAAYHPAKSMPAALCSTGEQKALLVSLILAHAALIKEARNQPPILLLDEAAAHLDPDRRKALFSALLEGGGQAFLTGTEAALFRGLPQAFSCYEIGAGKAVETASI